MCSKYKKLFKFKFLMFQRTNKFTSHTGLHANKKTFEAFSFFLYAICPNMSYGYIEVMMSNINLNVCKFKLYICLFFYIDSLCLIQTFSKSIVSNVEGAFNTLISGSIQLLNHQKLTWTSLKIRCHFELETLSFYVVVFLKIVKILGQIAFLNIVLQDSHW